MATKAPNKAVEAWRVYFGSDCMTSVKTQQKLYERARRLSKGRDEELSEIARGLGPIIPMPGKHY